MQQDLSAAQMSDDSHVRLGICVLNWNAGEGLTRCVRQLQIASKGDAADIVVVDNNSNDDSIDVLSSKVAGVRVIRNSTNLGYARGNNIGARYLDSRGCNYLLFVNPDVLISASAIASLLTTLDEDENAGAAGGLPENGHGISRMSARTKPTPFQKLVLYGPLHRLPFLNRLGPRHFLDWKSIRDGEPVYAICGACLLFRSNSFREAGGFDEATFLYEEELMMSERLRKGGKFFVLAKRCAYFHAEAASSNQMPYRRRLHFIDSEQHLLKNYYGWSLGLRVLFRVWRYIEWTIYAATWKFRPQIDTGACPDITDVNFQPTAAENRGVEGS